MFQIGTSCVEGEHRFNFDAGYYVCRFECSPFYSHSAQNFCSSCKEMDFVLYHPGKKELWLIEVKDYRFNARPRVGDLVEKLCRKVRDCLFLLRAAALCAPEEEPAEGISLREMARMSMNAKHIRVAFTIESGNTGLFPPSSLLATIKDLLYRQIKFIDPDMLCMPITSSGGWGPWTITPAGGELSSRIRHRVNEVKAARAKERKLAVEAERAAENRAAKKAKHAHKKQENTPLWKQRAEEREGGQSGTHADRVSRRRARRRHQHPPKSKQEGGENSPPLD